MSVLALAGALAPSGPSRRRFVEGLDAAALAEGEVAFVLRRLLAADGDATVRAAAAAALGRRARAFEAGGAAVAWLIDALDDLAPTVRDAAVRALAAHRATEAVAQMEALARGDEVWWVRRSAVYALGVAGGEAAFPAVRRAVSDPFWRVRHAAVQVLVAYGRRSSELRDELIAEVPPASAAYVRSLWGPAPAPALHVDQASPPSLLPAPLLDKDPAVVTARLASSAEVDPLALVELLCDPHQPLRELAAAKVAASHDAEAYRAALRWLEEPRIPHVARTVTELLDGLGDPARALAAEVLEHGGRPGALRWAIGYVVATRDDELEASARRRAVEAGLVGAALPLLAADELARLTAGGDALAVAAADELVARPSRARAAALAAIPPSDVAAIAARLAVAEPDRAGRHVLAALGAAEALPRAAALSRLAAAGQAPPGAVAAARADRDPMIRESVVAALSADELVGSLRAERDPWVRRALAAELGGRRDHVATRAAAALGLAADADPELRAHAAAWLVAQEPASRAALAALTEDPAPAVRAAIVERLVGATEEQLEELGHAAPAIVAAWRAAAGLDMAVEASPQAAPSRPRAHALPPLERASPPETSALGSSGVRTAPLVLSGAFELASGSLHAAHERGVDTFFWEPTYHALTKFLRAAKRQRGAQVITGTYHADAASIRLDVERALRRLRREVLDVYLLFWARSEARLDEEAFAVMRALQREGKVRAIGFSTHDRALAGRALAAAPWDVVMTRHSAAHPGAEAELFPAAAARGAGVLTFSALCYGRMVAGPGAPSASECYRYSLSQPGVTACISAPRRHRELLENLDVLAQPRLPEERLAELRRHGEGVRAEDVRFGQLIRRPTRDAAAAAMAMLEAELAPEADLGVRSATGDLSRRVSAPRAKPAQLRRGRW